MKYDLNDEELNLITSFFKVIMVNINKNGITNAIKIVDSYLETGDPYPFTREHNSRDVASKLDYEKLREVLNRIFDTDINYGEIVVKSILDQKIVALNKASVITYNKYGRNQLYSAIESLYKDNDASKFTNDDNCRDILSSMINNEDLLLVICKILDISSVYNFGLSRTLVDTEALFNSYADFIIDLSNE